MKLCFILVTRNRVDLAIATLRSLLTQDGDTPFDVVLSDNSESPEDTRKLEEHCRALADPRVIYIRPQKPMPMCPHWEWAIEQAMQLSDATHFGVQYDRKLWRPGELRPFAAACAVDPRATVAYACDVAFQKPHGVEAWTIPVTEKLYEIRTRTIADLVSRGMLYELGNAYPLLANCMAPRETMERVRARFGSICNSSTPDVVFTFRLCALDESFLYLDRASVIAFGYRFSNGFSYLRGDVSGAYGDWVKTWGDRPWLEAAPLPGLDLGLNILFHEYALVQREAGADRLPPIEREGYLNAIAKGLEWIDDRARKEKMLRILRDEGWREKGKPPLLFRIRRSINAALGRIPPPAPTFATDDEAVHYLLQPRPPAPHNPHLTMLDAIEVPFRA
ncbi:MAG TPA: hypothetical protein VM733_20595 [Thermoanaerobaculia bacterium]|nr:hypothetical protein [Thermoanaerobaculia bacterium]